MHYHDAGIFMHTFLPFRSVRWYTCHTCLCHPLAFYASLHACSHVHALLVCRPCFNTIKLWTSDPNLHLSLADATLCLFSCLFAFLLVCLLSCFFACHAYYHAYPFYAFSYALCIFPFHCLSASFLSLPLHVHTWSEDAWS